MKRSTSELITIPVAELQDRLHRAQEDVTTLNFALATRKEGNYARLKVLRREIARLKFFIDEKQREEAGNAI